MNDCLAHRGPDADGLWSGETAVLGHRRLSIIDTSPAGNQPFYSADKKIVLVFNGEIYNYIELKKELSASYSFITDSDTEVIIAAYLKWGISCVEHFLGMFAFALWDDHEQALYLVRDRMGIKPLYYAHTSEGWLFSSEIRPILSSGLVDRKISAASLSDYLRYQTVHAPRTIIEGIQMLMPGHYMKLDANGVQTTCFWDMVSNAKIGTITEDIKTVHRNIRELLVSAVEVRMRADVPFGAFLSGGIDSSIIVGLMSQISAHPVKTFSVTFHEKEFDESPYSLVIAQKFRTDHTPIRLSATDFMRLVPDALRAMDHPSGDGPNTYVVSKVTREAGVKMALSGLGGDEVFAGYDVFRRMHDLTNKQWLSATPLFMRKAMAGILKRMKPSVSSEKIAESLSKEKIDFAHLYPITRQIMMDDLVRSLVKDRKHYENPLERLAEKVSATDLPLLSKVSVAEMSSYMQNVLLRDADQMSMAHSLEVRVPLIDHRLVEYVLGVNDDQKFPHTAKQLLTESVKELLPREVIDRPKMGFTFPWAMWMRTELHSFCEHNIEALAAIEVLDHKNATALWQRFLAGDQRITWSRVWPLVVLGHWIKQHDVH